MTRKGNADVLRKILRLAALAEKSPSEREDAPVMAIDNAGESRPVTSDARRRSKLSGTEVAAYVIC